MDAVHAAGDVGDVGDVEVARPHHISVEIARPHRISHAHTASVMQHLAHH